MFPSRAAGDGPLLEVHPRQAVRERVGEQEREHTQHQPERPIGPEEAPLVPQHGAQDHGYATSARRTSDPATRKAPTSHSPSMAIESVRFCSTHPSDGAS